MKRLLTGLLLIASAVAVFAAPPTIKWTWATTNAPAELTNIVQAIAGTADASLPTNVVTRADTSGIIFTNTAGERITLLPSEDLGSNATVYLPGDLTPADGSISTNKLDATAIAWIDSQGDGTTSGGGYDTNEITMTSVLTDTTPVPVWTNSIASNRVHYVEARLAWAGVGGTNNAEDFLVARVSRDNTGAVTIGSTNSFTAIRTAAGDYLKTAATNQFALDILSNVRTGDNVFSGSNYFTGPVVVDNGNDTSTFHNIVASGTITGDLSGATNLPSTSITGVIPMANLATGSYTGTQFVKGDGTLANPPTSGGTSSVTWDSSNLILTLTDVVLSSLAWDTDNLIFTATY